VFLSEKYGGLQSIRDLCSNPEGIKDLLIRLPSGCQSGLLIRLLGSLPEKKTGDMVSYRDLEYNQETMSFRVTGEGEVTALTPKEARILRLFMLNPGRCWSRKDLQEQVWNGLRVSPRSIDSQISRLRKKLRFSEISIENKYGDGYIFR